MASKNSNETEAYKFYIPNLFLIMANTATGSETDYLLSKTCGCCIVIKLFPKVARLIHHPPLALPPR
jgi:hypothetical protein